jgi:mono/diheme cytochrome c family protein
MGAFMFARRRSPFHAKCDSGSSMKLTRSLLALAALACVAGPSSAQTGAAPSGGALLYDTYCVSCHTTQIHWRDRKLARDYASLTRQVMRWQANVGLQWTAEEIDEVARYLNATIYHLPQPAPRPVG